MAIKPSDHGIVVESKETGVRYAISDKNYNDKKVRKIRDLRSGETVHGYRPKQGSSPEQDDEEEEDHSDDVIDDSGETERAALLASGLSESEVEATMQANASKKTEGSAPAASKDAK